MMHPVDLRLVQFGHVLCRNGADLDLAQAALFLAEPEYPGLDIVRYTQQLDVLAGQVRSALVAETRPQYQALTVLRVLAQNGFHNEPCDYDDPQACFLNHVMDVKHGLPLLLGIIAIEVARRCGVPLQGVAFPGQFLLCTEGSSNRHFFYFDPATFRSLSAEDLQTLLHRSTGKKRPLQRRDLAHADKYTILARLLSHLRSLYLRQDDYPRFEFAAVRLRLLENHVPALAGEQSTQLVH
ncbi:MAG TPA: transglutaminase-like domain-containing protein [Pseudomonadota bacterium]|jgi:regulator of sirC expression with transglutaminase-like and TPR domain|nr:transglutaminase-like domain-containing protein [Pseudomonadota bacterium]